MKIGKWTGRIFILTASLVLGVGIVSTIAYGVAGIERCMPPKFVLVDGEFHGHRPIVERLQQPPRSLANCRPDVIQLFLTRWLMPSALIFAALSILVWRKDRPTRGPSSFLRYGQAGAISLLVGSSIACASLAHEDYLKCFKFLKKTEFASCQKSALSPHPTYAFLCFGLTAIIALGLARRSVSQRGR